MEIVSQISPPMRILLAGAVVFLAVWFTLLRPKSPEAPVTATSTPAGNVNTGQPAQSGAGKIVEKAKQAATEAEGAAKAAAGESSSTDKTQAATGSKTTTAPDAKPVDPVAAIAPEQLAKLPSSVASAIKDHKVLVLAVLSDKGKHWRPMADDDRYVRNTLKKVNRYDGEVLVKQVPLQKIDDYGLIVNDLKVNQTPSLVVVDTALKANVIEGYVDRVTINQAIADARADSISPLVTDSYLKSANKICANWNVSLDRWSRPTINGKQATIASMNRLSVENRSFHAAVSSLAAPKSYRGLRKQWLKVIALDQKLVDNALAAAKQHSTAGSSIVAWNGVAAAGGHIRELRKLDARFNDAGLTSCAINRSL